MLPFPGLDPAAITAEKDGVSRCRHFWSSVFLVSCSPMTSQPFAAQGLSRVSMCPIPLTPLTAAVRTLNVPNVSSSSRDLALATLCFLRADFLSARFPRRFFRPMPSAFHSVLGVFYLGSCLRSSDVLGEALQPRLDFSIVELCLLACAFRAFLLSSLRVPRIPRRRYPNFAGTVAAGNHISFGEVRHRQSMMLDGLHCQQREKVLDRGQNGF